MKGSKALRFKKVGLQEQSYFRINFFYYADGLKHNFNNIREKAQSLQHGRPDCE